MQLNLPAFGGDLGASLSAAGNPLKDELPLLRDEVAGLREELTLTGGELRLVNDDGALDALAGDWSVAGDGWCCGMARIAGGRVQAQRGIAGRHASWAPALRWP